ncbi:MAG: MBL fold metallo-hydrolase [Candidatus Edwardsbacteria bacterium]|nr:MBL fold metallo-hydrolase [Candidatus Edwardsbacteria bacterium]
MKITFWGAAKSVTGSQYVIEAGGKKLLLECGIRQGPRDESEAINRNLPFDPAAIDAMILSHAHLDHSGNIPTLVKNGFRGDIFMTAATRDLTAVILRDSARIQQSDTEFVNKRRQRDNQPPKEPLYTVEEAEAALKRFVGYPYERQFSPLPAAAGVSCVFHDAGHILGSAMVDLTLTENGRSVKFWFTGDLGRKNLPILKDPFQGTTADYLLTESTYGDRVHGPITDTSAKLEQIIKQVFARKGKVIIPAFSVGRTQEVVYELHKMFDAGKLPAMPIFVDSPMSLNVTALYRLHEECWDEEYRRDNAGHGDPLGFGRLTYITTKEESIALNDFDKPCVIISASGMCEGGRVLHHLKNSVGDPRNLVLIVGFQAQGTLGKRLVDKQSPVKIFGEPHELKAEIKVLNGFSAHADKEEILDYIKGFSGGVGSVILVHGEETQTMALAESVKALNLPAMAPSLGEELIL